MTNTNYSHRYPFTDIFIMARKGSVCHIRDKTGRNAWPEDYWPVGDVLEPTPRQFGDYTLNCPNNPHDYLDRY